MLCTFWLKAEAAHPDRKTANKILFNIHLLFNPFFPAKVAVFVRIVNMNVGGFYFFSDPVVYDVILFIVEGHIL